MYLSESRIWIELAWFSLTFAGCIERLIHQEETETSCAIMAVATMFQYGMMMFYFRPFKSFGHFVGMIERIVWDIRYYMCILAIIVYGYSQALFLVSTTVVPNSTDDFVNVENSFVKPQYAASEAIVYLVGNPIIPPVNTGNTPVSTFLACMLTVTGNIILLNLLVAIMNNTYQKIQLHSEAEWLKQLCVTLTEQKHYFGYRPDKYIHYLRRKVDVELEKQNNTKEFERDKKIVEGVKKDLPPIKAVDSLADQISGVKKSTEDTHGKITKLEELTSSKMLQQSDLAKISSALIELQESQKALLKSHTEQFQSVHTDYDRVSSALLELQAGRGTPSLQTSSQLQTIHETTESDF